MIGDDVEVAWTEQGGPEVSPDDEETYLSNIRQAYVKHPLAG
jgi:hypothetical protein